MEVAKDLIRAPAAKKFDESNGDIAFKGGCGTCAAKGAHGGKDVEV